MKILLMLCRILTQRRTQVLAKGAGHHAWDLTQEQYQVLMKVCGTQSVFVALVAMRSRILADHMSLTIVALHH